MAVLSTSAIVIVRLRRTPVATPDRTKLARISSSLVEGRRRTAGTGGARSAPDSVHAAVLVADDPAGVEFDDPAAHGVDDVVVVGGHDHGRAGAIDPLQQAHDALAGVR